MASGPHITRLVSERITHDILVETFDNGARGVHLESSKLIDTIQIQGLVWALYEEISCAEGTTMKFLTYANTGDGILRIRDNYSDWNTSTLGTRTMAIQTLEEMDPWTVGSLLDLGAGNYYAIFHPESVVPPIVPVTIGTTVKWGECYNNQAY